MKLQNLFSFEGRIGKVEYGTSVVIYFVLAETINALAEGDGMVLIRLIHLPLLVVLWAQGAKRCHDMGQSAWMQFIPFYFIYMIFAKSVYIPEKKTSIVPGVTSTCQKIHDAIKERWFSVGFQ
ncbi:MAG: rane protein [Bacteroidota bacterium]|nr:rane protein [Bacteroidota bacterium]